MYGVFCFNILIIGVKFLKKLSDRVKSDKNPCLNSWTVAHAPMSGRTHTNSYDNG
jgi:hypothetical protein